jgi:hypothetical protein
MLFIFLISKLFVDLNNALKSAFTIISFVNDINGNKIVDYCNRCSLIPNK